jgi:hypothetical protein
VQQIGVDVARACGEGWAMNFGQMLTVGVLTPHTAPGREDPDHGVLRFS